MGAGVVGAAALAGGGGEFVQDGVVGHHHGEHHGDDNGHHGHHKGGGAEPLCDPDFSDCAYNSHLDGNGDISPFLYFDKHCLNCFNILAS